MSKLKSGLQTKIKPAATITILFASTILLSSCNRELKQMGIHFQEYRDYASLKRVVELIPIPTDTSTLKKILGNPIDMTIDYRYIIDSIGPNGCPIGAVFLVDANGYVTNKWLDEICE